MKVYQGKREGKPIPKRGATKSLGKGHDKRPASILQRKLQGMANESPSVRQLKSMQDMAKNDSLTSPPIQKKENKTGLPDQLKSGIENLSGYSMDDVKVHYNSDKPAQLNAHAYAQGTDIHLAPGQEKHLPHEAWHVVQQKQGRVKPTMQMKGKVNVNDDEGLEKEADAMGGKALQMEKAFGVNKRGNTGSSVSPIIQMVKAYRVQYIFNKKVGEGSKITAPIDISFEFSDHSEYFLSERKGSQQLGLEVVSWEMDDDWYQALLHYTGTNPRDPTGKVKTIYDRFKKQNLPKPTKSDGKDCPEHIKKRALHFQAKWEAELNKAMKEHFEVRDIMQEKVDEKREEVESKFGDAKASYDEMVTIEKVGEGEMETTLGQFNDFWKEAGWTLKVPE